ncbi:AAA family ATPase [Desulfovibrio sp.]|uniref:AAA family ATPase n=1 Tax=Desulfovibrio sp. TaxID=885 RepID=UPI003D1313DC
MPVLLKIAKLKNYRFFSDFKWENDCCLFNKQFNLIYGWNGSGKTTLCDFFKEIEKGKPCPSGAQAEFLISDDFPDTSPRRKITHASTAELAKSLKVFDQNYIDDTFAGIDPIKHIVAVGKEQIHLLDNIDKWRKRRDFVIKYKNNHTLKIDKLNKAIGDKKSEIAKRVREHLGYPQSSFTKNHVDKQLQILAAPCTLSTDEIHKTLAEISGESREHIASIAIDTFDMSTANDIANILSESPSSIIIDDLANNSNINKWVEDGLALHEEQASSTCLFCRNPIGTNRLESLKKHFDDSYRKISTKVESKNQIISSLIKSLEVKKSIIPDKIKFYTEFRDEYEGFSKQLVELIESNIRTLNKLKNILEKKKIDLINQKFKDDFLDTYSEYKTFDTTASSINNVIDRNNFKTANFIKEIDAAKEKIKIHHLSEGKSELDSFDVLSKSFRAKSEKIDRASKKINKKLEQLEKTVKNTKLPAERINKDIAIIFGRQEISFVDQGDGYKIFRGSIEADNLSRGEQNAVALIYFFNSLEDYNIIKSATIIMLDDPISSFDSNFYFNILAYIRDHCIKYKQIFLLTHKFSVTRDCMKLFDKKLSNRYVLKRSNDSPVLLNEHKLLNENYWDEYVYLFSLIYDFTQNPPANYQEYFIYPNIARRLLEAFLAFKIPGNEDLVDKIANLSGTSSILARAVLRLAHGKSHLRTIGETNGTDFIENYEELPQLFKNLLIYIEEHDSVHYHKLKELCGYPDEVEPTVVVPPAGPTTHIVRLYTEMPVAAGIGEYLHDGDFEYEEIEVLNDKCNFALKVSGDSMEPEIPDGSCVMIHATEEVAIGRIGIFILDREAYIKRLIQKGGQYFLQSTNKKYGLISVNEHSNLRTVGEFIGLLPAAPGEE